MDNKTLIIIFFIANIIWSLLNIFFKEYFKEKGKNLATKEDIEVITTKVENLKLELANSHFQKSDFLQKRKDSLISFYEQFILVSEAYLNNLTFIDIFVFNPEKIRENTEKIIFEYSKLEKEFWKVNLFEIDDTIFIENIKKIMLYKHEYYNSTINFLWKIENNSLFLSKKPSTELVEQRKKLKDDYLKEKNEMDKINLKLPQKLLVQIQNKYLTIIK